MTIARSARWLAAGLALAALLSAAPAGARRATRVSTTADKPADQAPRTGLHRVRGGMHLEVKARDLRLSDADEDKLRHIAARYFKATRKRLIVTGGTRPPERQAELMIGKLRHGDDIIALYENKAAATEIQSAYRDALGKHLAKKQITRAVTEIIRAQIGRGIYVSRHLQSGAVDVRSWGMSVDQVQALRDALKEEPGVSMLDERSGPEPHLHLSL